MPIVGHWYCPPTGIASRYSLVEVSSSVCSVPELFNFEHSFLPPLDTDLDIAIALNMGQQPDMLRLRRSYRLRSYHADFGTARAVLLDKSLCRAQRHASSNVMIFLQENICTDQVEIC